MFCLIQMFEVTISLYFDLIACLLQLYISAFLFKLTTDSHELKITTYPLSALYSQVFITRFELPNKFKRECWSRIFH